MKMAKPSEKDIHAADDLCLILSIVDSSLSRFNGDFVDDDIPDLFTLYDNDCFDETNMLHLQALFNKLANLIYRNPAFYHRVIGGMCHVIMYSENQIIDPDSDTIDLHPRFQEMYEDLQRERQAARYWNMRHHQTEQKLQLYKSNAVAYECICIQCRRQFLGEKEQHFCFRCLFNEMENLREERNRFVAETERLDKIINSPQKDDFIRAVSTEAENDYEQAMHRVAQLEIDVERLVDHAANLGIAVRDEDTDLANDSWRSLPEHLQDAINAKSEQIEMFSVIDEETGRQL